MGYDVHITRADDWLDAASKPISLDQWLAYIRSDPEMRLDGYAIAKIDEQAAIAYENEGLAVWVTYSQHNPNGNMAWFDFRSGRIVVKNPDDEILGKMKRIADYFSANVFGDDGEPY